MKKKAKKKSKNNKRIRNWMQESQKKDISTDKRIDDKSSEEKNEDVSIEKKSRKTKTVLLSVGRTAAARPSRKGSLCHRENAPS